MQRNRKLESFGVSIGLPTLLLFPQYNYTIRTEIPCRIPCSGKCIYIVFIVFQLHFVLYLMLSALLDFIFNHNIMEFILILPSKTGDTLSFTFKWFCSPIFLESSLNQPVSVAGVWIECYYKRHNLVSA